MSLYDGIALDLDDTLVDRSGAVERWLRRITGGDGVEELVQLDAGGYGDRAILFEALSRRTGWQVPKARTRLRAGILEELTLMPGAEALVERLLGRVQLAIATNGAVAIQRAKIEVVGLDRQIPTCVISEAIGHEKPSAAFYAVVLERLGTPAGRALMVGDHPTNDVLGAGRAGLSTCWLRSSRHVPPDDSVWTVDHLSEIQIS